MNMNISGKWGWEKDNCAASMTEWSMTDEINPEK
jgi:hypothetical protein